MLRDAASTRDINRIHPQKGQGTMGSNLPLDSPRIGTQLTYPHPRLTYAVSITVDRWTVKCETASTGARSAMNAPGHSELNCCTGRPRGRMPFSARVTDLWASSPATNSHALASRRTGLRGAHCPRIGARRRWGASPFISRTSRPVSETVPCCRGTKCDFWEPFCTPSLPGRRGFYACS